MIKELSIKNDFADYCYALAQWTERSKANTTTLESCVILSNRAVWCYKFAFMVEGANIQRLYNIVLKTGDMYYIKRFRQRLTL